MDLPQDYLDRVQAQLGPEYPDFYQSYQEPRTYGLRVNTLKVNVADLVGSVPFHLEPIPWAEEGYYYQQQDEPGKHPYHDAGLYYIQEPSAMAVGSLVNPEPGEKVLDLAAAPGGKSTHIAVRMRGQGLLIANEINFARAKALSQNVERLGIANCIVLSENPEDLAKRFPGFFDRVLVDAPCSGEGMFRKDSGSCAEWSRENVVGCATRQAAILDSAAAMVRPGGWLIYSTCTFSPLENEDAIASFLTRHSEYYLEQPPMYPGFTPGRPEWANNPLSELARTVRLWPHLVRGEGHFAAVMRRGREVPKGQCAPGRAKRPSRVELESFHEFISNNLRWEPVGDYLFVGDHLYLIPENCPDLDRLRTLRPGLHLGTRRKLRFEPSHSLALYLRKEQVLRSVNLPWDSLEIRKYLRGETLSHHGEKGWCLVCVDGHSLGWAKQTGGVLKNHYPKGLRHQV